jgi:SNF family Na+-dependent transporter
LAVRGLTLGTSGASEIFLMQTWDGLNFLWTAIRLNIRFEGWMAAAGQIFFTLSVGMEYNSLLCSLSMLRHIFDTVSTGFMNEFVEVVLGSLIVIPSLQDI